MTYSYYKRIWFTSDWHIGHKNILQFCPNRMVDGVTDLESMAEKLIENYNSVVKDCDIGYFLGDFSFHGSADQVKEVVSRLNGTKICIKGNHDRGNNALYNAGFDVVLNHASIKLKGNILTMSHFPLKGVYREVADGECWHGEKKYSLLTLEDRGERHFHVHGHLHAPNRGKSEVKLGRQWDVGVDGNGMMPVPMRHVLSWIDRYNQK